MKRFFLPLLCLLLILPQVLHGEKVSGDDARITYIGRTLVKDGEVSFDWTGVYLKTRFKGNYLEFKISDTGKNYYNVWLDSPMSAEPDKVIRTHGTDTTIVIFSKDEIKALKGPHQVILQKRTEGSQGMTTIKELTTDGVFLQADKPSGRVIEFVGDSYTCGYGTEASNKDRFSPETENQNLTYACKASRYFDADQIIIAHSGMGVVRNYNGNSKEAFMPDIYPRTYDRIPEPAWNASDFTPKPSLTVIYLGTNDFSTGLQPAERVFVKGYVTLLKEIKDFYGESHPILCVAPKHDPLQETYIRKAIESAGMTDVHLLALSYSVHDHTGDLGADGHPNGPGHTKLAYTIIPVISTIMGWEMTGKEIK
ncbi:MAG: hypothetical protein IKW99_03295 [Bacteroidales bacterium]|nr:hypothetical protein [Bacteroidales bacterium]